MNITKRRKMCFIDGENLVIRYQKMLKTGKIPLEKVKHIQNVYVWSDVLISRCRKETDEMLRVSYYTSASGNDEQIDGFRAGLHQIHYQSLVYNIPINIGHQRLADYRNIIPRVYKKIRGEAKSHSVDINITIDIMNFALSDAVDEIVLISGDGDFLPLIQRVMRTGKRMHVMALSDGLNQKLKHSADSFTCIDNCFLAPKT